MLWGEVANFRAELAAAAAADVMSVLDGLTAQWVALELQRKPLLKVKPPQYAKVRALNQAIAPIKARIQDVFQALGKKGVTSFSYYRADSELLYEPGKAPRKVALEEVAASMGAGTAPSEPAPELQPATYIDAGAAAEQSALEQSIAEEEAKIAELMRQLSEPWTYAESTEAPVTAPVTATVTSAVASEAVSAPTAVKTALAPKTVATRPGTATAGAFRIATTQRPEDWRKKALAAAAVAAGILALI